MGIGTGARLGSYEILSAIGAGGMGEVYLGRDSRLGRDVAIKVLPDSFARDAERTSRFEREARLLATLNDKNIASIYGIEDSNGSLALVMEYVPGPTLADRLDSGPLPIDEALPIARQIAEGLEYAHEHGVIHRDLKPANIKVAPDDTVKILDFGLAKVVQGEASGTDIRNSPTLTQMATQAGVLLGTAAYMSPEQARGKSVDRRADIWAFGCVLFEMLAGKMAFYGDGVSETLAAVLRNEPDWSLLPKETPLRVRVLLQRCLQKDPKHRLRDIGDARISLDEVLTGAPDPALAGTVLDTSSPWRRALPWGLASLLFVALASLAFVHFRKESDAPAMPIRVQMALPEEAAYVPWVVLSPDGRHLAFSAEGQDGHRQLWLRDLDSFAARPVPGTDGGYIAAWSPDSRQLAFYNGTKLERTDISGGFPQVICAASAPYFSASWNSDNVIIFGIRDGIMKVSASGGEPSMLVKNTSGAERTRVLGYPAFLPDGRHFVYIGPVGTGLGIFTGSLDAGSDQHPGKPLDRGRFVLYAPASKSGPGHLLYIRPDATLVAQPFDPSGLKLEGDATPIAEAVRNFTVSANGVMAYLGGPQESTPLQLEFFDRQGKSLGKLGAPGALPYPAISPDGKTVAVSRTDGTGGEDIWLYDLATGKPTRFTFDRKSWGPPVWSPDGSRLAFASNRQGFPVVYQKTVNGMGGEEALEPGQDGTYMAPTDWSRDGNYLAEQFLHNPPSVWVLPLSSGKAGEKPKSVPLVNDGSNRYSATFSPVGHWIAYDSNETGRDEIFVQTFPNPGGKWQVSSNGGSRPVWSRDGKELYYIAPDGNLMAADVRSRPDGSFDAGSPKALFRAPIEPYQSDRFDVTKDGRFLIPVVTRQEAEPITLVVNWSAGMK